MSRDEGMLTGLDGTDSDVKSAMLASVGPRPTQMLTVSHRPQAMSTHKPVRNKRAVVSAGRSLDKDRQGQRHVYTQLRAARSAGAPASRRCDTGQQATLHRLLMALMGRHYTSPCQAVTRHNRKPTTHTAGAYRTHTKYEFSTDSADLSVPQRIRELSPSPVRVCATLNSLRRLIRDRSLPERAVFSANN